MNQFFEWVSSLYTKPLLSFSIFDLFCLGVVTLVALGIIDGVAKGIKKLFNRDSQAGQEK